MVNLLNRLQDVLETLRHIDFLGPLALRLYLAPVFWVAGLNKLNGFDMAVHAKPWASLSHVRSAIAFPGGADTIAV